MGNSKNKKELAEYLKSQNLMTLGTFDKKPWVCTVYFVTDSDLNFYFVSSPKSKHCEDIEKNRNVAIAVYDSHTINSEKKVGVQMQGIASQVKGWNKTEILLKIWHKAAPGMESVVNLKNMKDKVTSSRVYKVKPTYIKFFNQKLYGEDGFKEFRI